MQMTNFLHISHANSTMWSEIILSAGNPKQIPNRGGVHEKDSSLCHPALTVSECKAFISTVWTPVSKFGVKRRWVCQRIARPLLSVNSAMHSVKLLPKFIGLS